MLLKFVIAGIEHSGTTLLSDLFRQVPGLDSGFEVGALLCQSPREFRHLSPFIENLKPGWGLKDQDLDYICNCESFADFYARLRERSTVVDHQSNLFDKTPRYFMHLEECLARTDAPLLVTYKDPRSIVHSDFVRGKAADFNRWYAEYVNGKRSYMRKLNQNMQTMQQSPRVHFLSLESICVDSARTLEAAFAHVGQVFHPRYLAMKNLRYAHNHHNFIDSSVPFKFYDALKPGQLATIEKDFAEFDAWFYR